MYSLIALSKLNQESFHKELFLLKSFEMTPCLYIIIQKHCHLTYLSDIILSYEDLDKVLSCVKH